MYPYYICVSSDSASKLSGIVNSKMNLGYVPIGGVAVSGSGKDVVFSQALVGKDIYLTIINGGK